MGANTPGGFFSCFGELQDPAREKKLYLIHGGPGTGKSTWMKQTAEQIRKAGLTCELIRCSADPSSLDAVRAGDGLFSVADATAPHAMEPRYPGAFEEVIDFSPLLNSDILVKDRERIIALTDQNRELHRKTDGILSAASALKNDSLAIGTRSLQTEKIKKYADRRVHVPKNSVCGTVHRRFLTAVSGRKIAFLTDFLEQCQTLTVIDDPIGSAAAFLLQRLCGRYISAGYDVYACFCTLSPASRIEHLIVPALSVGYTTSNFIHPFNRPVPHQTIHARRFYDEELLQDFRGRLGFNSRMIDALVRQAAENETAALSGHNELEKLYGAAMDYDRQRQMMNRFLAELDTRS